LLQSAPTNPETIKFGPDGTGRFNRALIFNNGESTYMQKSLMALIIAGLAYGPAFAQSNVTLYGILDVSVAAGSAGDNDFRGLVNSVLNGNRFGFKGSEDLGNGLKAVFQLEQGFNIDDGTPNSERQFHRQSWVGLQGSFGTVGLGRQYAPGYFGQYDAALSANISPQTILTSLSGLTISPSSLARWDNAIAYTASFSGLTVRANYSTNAIETSDEPENDDKWGVGVDYANGPFKAGAVYHSLTEEASRDQHEWYVGAQYDFGVLTLAGSWQSGSDVGPGDLDKRLWNLGVIVPVSAAGKVHASYGALEERDRDEADVKNWVLYYTHALSKRTTAYAGYNRTVNDDAAQLGLVRAPAGVTGEDSSLAMIGMRHTF
jgi:predicted porin